MDFDLSELVAFIISSFLLITFAYKWYFSLFFTWHSGRDHLEGLMLGTLPVISFIIICYTLNVLASFDVVDNPIYIVFYMVMGYAWIYAGLTSMFFSFDISWRDDVMNLNNKAALFSVAGGFIAHALIYSGANIGDGPGWWCVVFAGGLGLAAWLVLGIIVNNFTGIFERITIERDVPSGVRFCFYLLASGIILGRASAGDWTSFPMTVIEFAAGWPVLILTALMIAIERYYKRVTGNFNKMKGNYLFSSVCCGILLIVLAIASLALMPQLPVNYGYRSALPMMTTLKAALF